MATKEQAIRTIPKRTNAYNNAPLNSNNGAIKSNPITPNDIYVTDTGIVREKKGRVYINYSDKSAEPLWFEVVIMDEFGNIVPMVRHSDKEDVSSGSYVNNQGVKNRPIPISTKTDGSISRNVTDAGTTTL